MAGFKVGDVVQLKSGGPKMTVIECDDSFGEPTTYCAWFEGSKKVKDSFPPDALKSAMEETKGSAAQAGPARSREELN